MTEQELEVKAFNKEATGILCTTYNNIQYVMRKTKDFLARTELLAKINSLIQELNYDEYKQS